MDCSPSSYENFSGIRLLQVALFVNHISISLVVMCVKQFM